MNRIDLTEALEPGLYAVRSESATVYVLWFRRKRSGFDGIQSTMIRIPGVGSTVGASDLQWVPVVRVLPPEADDLEPSRIELGQSARWVFGSPDPTTARHPLGDFAWRIQRLVTSIELISFADLLILGEDRGVQVPGDEFGLGNLLWRSESGTELLIECRPGWWPILADLDVALAGIAPDYVVKQVKEKFGGLRFYASTDRFDQGDGAMISEPLSNAQAAEFRRLIDEAERKCSTVCEFCGEPGTTRKARGWWQTVCDRHAAS